MSSRSLYQSQELFTGDLENQPVALANPFDLIRLTWLEAFNEG